MSAVLLSTLAWTGVLIAAVLVLRRPVARHLGPEAAYALWALPMARLVLPPVVLPAWMAPAPAAPPAAAPLAGAAPQAESHVWHVAADAPAAAAASLTKASLAVPIEAAPQAGFDLVAMLAALPLAELVLALWLGGAGVVLWRRFSAYFALRAVLLAEGREVGRAKGLIGKVRLVETPATAAPLALGVLDPVIALPPGFMAHHDRTGRDLALAHELAHHRAGDLLVNVLVQPLFALHWFSPLGRYGWLALRRDQEAACDARVIVRRDPTERAAYAALIARFAAVPDAGGNAALTAPMACPVLGEKSIIHRLRSLAMSDPTPRRRLAGRALLGAGLLALPLTASISYAAAEAQEGVEVPAPPAPPAPVEPLAPPAPPAAPGAPEAPAAPAAPSILVIDPDAPGETNITERVWRDEDGTEKRSRIVVRKLSEGDDVARHLEGWRGADVADREAMMAELKAGLAEADRAMADLPRIIAEAMAAAEAGRSEAMRAAGQPRVIVRHECKPGSEEVTETTSQDGKQIISICQKRIFVSARKGLEEAREEIARDKDIPEETRKQVLETLDRQIERWSSKEG